MSEPNATDTPVLTPDPEAADQAEELFSANEIREFDHDDVVAGKAIGKMLSIIFLYTLIAMSIASWWTWKTIVGG